MVAVVLWFRAVCLLILVYAIDVLQAVVNTIGMIAYPGESVYKMRSTHDESSFLIDLHCVSQSSFFLLCTFHLQVF